MTLAFRCADVAFWRVGSRGGTPVHAHHLNSPGNRLSGLTSCREHALFQRHGGRRPAIHVFTCRAKDVDAVAKPRHDGCSSPSARPLGRALPRAVTLCLAERALRRSRVGLTTQARQRAPSPQSARMPATAPLMQVASVPDRIDRTPSATTSCRRSGTIAPRPPITIPRLPKFAKPHNA